MTTPNHPIFTGTRSVAILTADHPKYETMYPRTESGTGHERLLRILENGLATPLGSFKPDGFPEYTVTKGRYEKDETSVICLGEFEGYMRVLARQFGQESIVWIPEGPNGYLDGKLVYVNGPNRGKYHLALPEYEIFETEPEDMFTLVPGIGYLRLSFDFSKLLELDDE